MLHALLFLLIRFLSTQVEAQPRHHESCPTSGRDCSSQVPVCPSAVPGTPVEVVTEKNGAFVITGHAGSDAQWRNVLREEITACLKEVLPAGKEPGNIPQYLCRTIFNSHWMTGKITLHVNNCDFTCDIYVGFTELRIPITNDKPNQILTYQEPTLNWISYPAEEGGLPDNFVNAGQGGEIYPVCRHTDADSNIFIGIFLREGGQCAFLNGRKGSTATTNIEILAPPPAHESCQEQMEQCFPKEVDDLVELGYVKDGRYYETGYAANRISWRTVTSKDIRTCLKTVKPNGMENNHPLYTCRTLHGIEWVPGKIEFDENICELTCDISEGEEAATIPIDEQLTQILIDPNSATKWVPYSVGDTLPTNVINGGINANIAVAILCRYKDGNGNIFMGIFYGDFKYCMYLQDNIETQATDVVEVLVSTAADEGCPEQKDSCTFQSDDAVSLAVYSNSTTTVTGKTESLIKWRTIKKQEVFECLKETTALGIEPGPRKQFLCRAFNKDEWYPGKIAFEHSDCNPACEVIIENVVRKIGFDDENKVQILFYPHGDLHWVKVPKTGTDLEDVIIGAQRSKSGPTPICRFSDQDGNKYIGHFTPGFAYGTCLYQEGAKVSSGRGDNVEVLVHVATDQGLVGRAGVKQPCKDQLDVCPSASGTRVAIGVLKDNTITKTGYASDNIQWRHVAGADVVSCLAETTNGGQGPKQIPQYICQTLHKNIWVPGKVLFDEDSCNFTCDIGGNSKTVRTPIDDDEKTQILMFPETALNWVKLSSFSGIVNNAIIGGENINGDPAPICRFVNENGDKLLGRLFAACMTCIYTIGEKEFSENNPFNIEVLLQAPAVKSCPKQKPSCSSCGGDTVETGVYRNGSTKVGAEEELKWRNVEEDEITACLKATTDIETEVKANPQYLCRVFHEFHWVPGKLEYYDNPCNAACDIIVDLKVIRIPFGNGNKIQVLNYGPGMTSWNPLKPNNATNIDSFIIGGRNPKDEIIPICRFKDGKGNKFIGHFALGHNTCWYLKGDKVSITCNTKLIEILVLGGDNTNHSDKDRCAEQQETCPDANKTPVTIGQYKVEIPIQDAYWKSIQPDNVLACANTTTAALNGQYICRTHYNNKRISGTLAIKNKQCTVTCDIFIDGKLKMVRVENNQTTEILVYQSSLNWTKVSWGIQGSLVNGGVFDKGEISYICRYKDEYGKLFLGRYSSTTNVCWFVNEEYKGEYKGNDTSRMELLRYTKGGVCDKQKSICLVGRRAPVEYATGNLSLLSLKGTAGTNVQWRYLENDEVLACVNQTTRSGIENGIPAYICRAFYDNMWIPGKLLLYPWSCDYFCDTAYNGKANKVPVRHNNVQILIWQPKHLTWKNEMAIQALPNAAWLIGGKNSTSFIGVCRDPNKNQTSNDETDSSYVCNYMSGDKEIRSSGSNFEVAILEPDGDCYTKISSCPDYDRGVVLGQYKNGQYYESDYRGQNIGWTVVSTDNVISCLDQTFPFGVEPDHVQTYFCRAHDNNEWRQGKMRYDRLSCRFSCEVLLHDTLINYYVDDQLIELLMFPKGAIKTVSLPLSGDFSVDNVLMGGRNELCTTTLLCRYYVEDGSHMIGSMGPNKTCISTSGYYGSFRVVLIDLFYAVDVIHVRDWKGSVQ